MKCACGGFDYRYNAQAGVDDTAHIVVAAELTNCAADSEQLPVVLAGVTHSTGGVTKQVVADAGDRSEEATAVRRDGGKIQVCGNAECLSETQMAIRAAERLDKKTYSGFDNLVSGRGA